MHNPCSRSLLLLLLLQGLKCLYPPPDRQDHGEGAVEVTALDLSRLDSDEFLNDTVIDFYLRWVGCRD